MPTHLLTTLTWKYGTTCERVETMKNTPFKISAQMTAVKVNVSSVLTRQAVWRMSLTSTSLSLVHLHDIKQFLILIFSNTISCDLIFIKSQILSFTHDLQYLIDQFYNLLVQPNARAYTLWNIAHYRQYHQHTLPQ